MSDKPIPLVGIVGGIASGKSFVAEQMQRNGAAIILADQLAHAALRRDEVKAQVRRRWGPEVFGADGEVDRKALGQIVFAPLPDGPPELAALERMTHPLVRQMVRDEIQRLRDQKTAAVIVLDVPLLFEAGWNKFCDKIIFVDAPLAVRLERAQARGWTPEEFARREAAQGSLEMKRNGADVVIDNAGTAESVQAQIRHFWSALVGLPARN